MSAISTPLDDALYSAAMANVRGIREARAELAQLRTDLQAARDERDEAKAWHISLNAMIDRKNATIAEQARQLDAARNLIIRSGRVINNLKKPDSVYDLTSDLLDWLAANPAPEADPQP